MQREQHKFFREQRDKKPDLELWVTGMQPEGDGATMLTFSVRNGGNAVADGFAWEIILPYSVFPFVEFEVDDDVVWTTTDYPNVTNVNFFRKEVHVPKLFVGDLVSVASIVVKEQSFEPFAIQWRLYSAHGTVPESGHKTIRVAPRPQGLLDVHPVLQIPAVLPV